MKDAVQIFQSISALLLIVFVLMQIRGTGLARSSNSSNFTRRGLEKLIFRLTFLTAFLFLALSAISIFI